MTPRTLPASGCRPSSASCSALLGLTGHEPRDADVWPVPAGCARLVLKLVPWIPPSPPDRDARLPALTYVPLAFDFVSTLGFPGEGPLFFTAFFFLGLWHA